MAVSEQALEVTWLPVGELEGYAKNAKVHTHQQVDQIARSIQEFGFNDPVGIWHRPDGTAEIVEGHGRVMAARQLGMSRVPVITLDALTDEQRRAYAIVHNKLTMSTDFDLDTLTAELDALDFDWDDFGFDGYGDDVDFDPSSVSEVDEPETVEQRVSVGDVWQLGGHRLMCGDSSRKSDVDTLLDGVSLSMVFTDPPYGVAIGSKNALLNTIQKSGRITEDIAGDTLQFTDIRKMVAKSIGNLSAHCLDTCSFYVCAPPGGDMAAIMGAMEDAGYPVRHILIWVKNAPTFSMGRLDYDYQHEPILYTWGKRHEFHGGYGRSVIDDAEDIGKMSKHELLELVKAYRGAGDTSVLRYDKPVKCDLHPTMKPVKLAARFVHNSSPAGGWVGDMFGGSGTTLLAAEQLGRRCATMEVDPHYCDVIMHRWEDLTGGSAVRIRGGDD